MQIILATWWDELNVPFFNDVFDSDLDIEEISKFYLSEKERSGKYLISQYHNTLVFSDGTRVILERRRIKTCADEDDSVTSIPLTQIEFKDYYE